jgi:tRNA nucleotidyltransferase (CCA-adding enzyme)
MQTYVVGGAVRDELLGLPVQDHDHVVVGATPEDMVRQGFRPVGKDFPVFLHPQTQEEYALARTERKTAPGYKGFVFHTSPDVTLEQDLVRRDLTVNAIAKAADGALIDPFNGRADIAARVFRHVSDAFAEDPVRILRVARFAARYGDFTVAPETNALMRQMVEQGEADALVAERVWQEVSRGLMEAAPSRMFEVLRDCGALARIMPELDAGPQAMRVIDDAARRGLELPVRFAALLQGQGGSAEALKAVDRLCQRLKVPAECRDLAVMAAREQDCVNGAQALDAGAIVKLLERCDGFRKPARFSQLLQAVQAGTCGGAGHEADCPYPQRARLETALAAARAVNAGEIAQACGDQPQRIPERVRQARVAAVRTALGLLDNEKS